MLKIIGLAEDWTNDADRMRAIRFHRIASHMSCLFIGLWGDIFALLEKMFPRSQSVRESKSMLNPTSQAALRVGVGVTKTRKSHHFGSDFFQRGQLQIDGLVEQTQVTWRGINVMLDIQDEIELDSMEGRKDVD